MKLRYKRRYNISNIIYEFAVFRFDISEAKVMQSKCSIIAVITAIHTKPSVE